MGAQCQVGAQSFWALVSGPCQHPYARTQLSRAYKNTDTNCQPPALGPALSGVSYSHQWQAQPFRTESACRSHHQALGILARRRRAPHGLRSREDRVVGQRVEHSRGAQGGRAALRARAVRPVLPRVQVCAQAALEQGLVRLLALVHRATRDDVAGTSRLRSSTSPR